MPLTLSRPSGAELLGPPVSKIQPVTHTELKQNSICQKIWNIAKNIFKVALSIFLYCTNPTLCAVGFITGIIYDEQVRNAIKKIKGVWTTQPLSIAIIGGVASFLSLPVTLAASSFLWAAHIGSAMSREAQRRLQPFLQI